MAGKRGTGSWAPSALFSLLRRTRYIGIIEWNRTEKLYRKGTRFRREREAHDLVRIEAPHMRILTDELWVGAQSQMRRDKIGIPTNGDKKKAGRKPAYLLTGLTRCSLCGGPLTVIGSRDGTTPIKAYICAYRHDRGSTVCTNKHRRPIVAVNDLVMRWVEANVLSEEMLLESLKKVRARLAVRSKQVTSEMPALQGRAAKLKAEIANIVDVLAVTPKEHAAGLIAGMGERQVELSALEARIAATKLAPESDQL